MSLADVQAEVAQESAFNDVLFQADRASQLTHTIHQLLMLRNRPLPEMAPELLTQRRTLLDVTIAITKKELKTVAMDLAQALIKWRETDK